MLQLVRYGHFCHRLHIIAAVITDLQMSWHKAGARWLSLPGIYQQRRVHLFRSGILYSPSVPIQISSFPFMTSGTWLYTALPEELW